jgi:hypothetical protein
MEKEIKVKFIIETTRGNTITKQYTDEINAGYSKKFIRNSVRSQIYIDYPNTCKVVLLKIKEEAEIYGNI